MTEGEQLESFVFYESWVKSINKLPDDEQTELILAMVKYGLYGDAPKYDDTYKMAFFENIMYQIDSAKGRRKASAKGGRNSKGVKKPHKRAAPNVDKVAEEWEEP